MKSTILAGTSVSSSSDLPPPPHNSGRASQRITPVNLFAAPSRSRAASTVAPGSPGYASGMHLTGLSGPVSPGHPSHAEPPGSVTLHSIAVGRLPALEAEATLNTLKPIGVRAGHAVPRGEIVGVGTAATRKNTRSILSRLHIPSIKTQLHFKRRFQILIWTVTVLFFLVPLIGIVYTHFGTDFQVPPSTFHHKNVDGPFYSTALRICIGIYGAVYFLYVLVITIWSLRRSDFFPFKIRPLLLVYASNFFGLCILVWLWTRYVLSDTWSNDKSGDGLFPPCVVSQLMVGVAQFGLIAPYVLRAWQLSRIFSADYSAASAEKTGKSRDRHDPARGSTSTVRNGGGAYVPSSPSLHSVYSDDIHSTESTPRLAPQHPSPSRAFLTSSLHMDKHSVLAGTSIMSNTSAASQYVPPGSSMILNRGTSSGYVPAGSSLLSTPPRGNNSRAIPHPVLNSSPSQQHRRGRHGGSYAYSHVLQVGTGATQSPGYGPHSSPSRRNNDGSGEYEFSAPTSIQASPMHQPDQKALPNFPQLDGDAVKQQNETPAEVRLRGCLDNLNDVKLSWIYFGLLLPFISITVLSFYIPSLQPLTNFDCTDEGPETRTARIIWTAFGAMEILGFALSVQAT